MSATDHGQGGGPLVLTRKTGEEIVLLVQPGTSEHIHVYLTEVAHNKVRLAITAPQSVGIFRSEVFQQSTGLELPKLPFGALILSRKTKEEVILIPQDHSLTRAVIIGVSSVVSMKTRLSFIADRSVSVFRKEVLERIEQDRQSGANITKL